VTELTPSLRSNESDHAATALQSLTSLVDVVAPGLGSFFGTMIGYVLPNQRLERFGAFATKLARRLQIVEGSVDELRAQYIRLAQEFGPEQRALFEDGAYAAIRATTDDRIDVVSRIVAEGLAGDEVKATEQRRVLDLIGDLSDEDIVVLCSYTSKFGRDDEWRALHSQVLTPVRAGIGSSQDDLDQQVLRDLRTDRLLRLGVLLEETSAGGRSTRRNISPRGRYVLRKLGLVEGREA
jgi:hypothetical protein